MPLSRITVAIYHNRDSAMTRIKKTFFTYFHSLQTIKRLSLLRRKTIIGIKYRPLLKIDGCLYLSDNAATYKNETEI